jgi:hypothetical protein
MGVSPLGILRRRCEDNIKMDIRKIGLKVLCGFIWLRIGPCGGFCEHGNESPGSIKEGELLD